METTNLILLVVGVMAGLSAGWLFWRGSVKRELYERAESKLAAARHRIEAAEADRLAISGQALELQRALRAERSLLDGVAAQAGIAPHDFRRTLARDVLHRSDPYRARYLDEPIELERRVGQLSEMRLGVRPMVTSADFGTTDTRVVTLDATASTGDDQVRELLAGVRSELDRRTTELDQVIEEARAVAGELATTERELDTARETMRQLDQQVRDLLADRPTPPAAPAPMAAPDRAHWSDPSRRVASLSEEVAALRARLADRAIESDELVTRLAQHADVDRLLAYIAAELDRLRLDVVQRAFPRPSGE